MKLLKIPFGAGGMGHGNGSAYAPDKILDALKEVFTNEFGVKHSFEHVNLVVDNNNASESHKLIQESVPEDSFVAIGGDHSITHPLLVGFAKYNSNFKLIVFDAHPDLVHNFHPPTQEDYLRTLIEDNIIKPENILLVGVRNSDVIELNYMNEKNISCIFARDIFSNGIFWLSKQLVDFCQTDIPVYVSFDIDVVDPVYAPGTGYTEPGGLTSREAIYLVQSIAPFVHSADIVEVNPEKDINDMTSSLAAKLLVEFWK